VADGKVTSEEIAPIAPLAASAPICSETDLFLTAPSSSAAPGSEDFLLSSLSDAADLAGLVDMANGVPLQNVDHVAMTSATTSSSVKDGASLGCGGEEVNDGFCEMFTDLTDFLLEVGSLEPSAASNSKQGEGARKRTATEALLEAMEQEVLLPSSSPSPTSPVDHSDYTLKPRPKKRARTATVTSESDAESVASAATSTMSALEKSTERRIKNNIASKRSRETRKQKFAGMEEEAVRLEKANRELEAKIAQLEAMAKKMKAKLVERMAKK